MTRVRERWFYALIAPWLIGLLALQVGPLAWAGVVSLTDWQPPTAPRFLAAQNYLALFADVRFIKSAVNTLVYAAATVGPGLLIGLGLALLLARLRRGAALARALVFMPAVVAGVATTLMWGWILNPRFGLLNGLLAVVGIDGPAWLRDPGWAMPAVIVIGLWGVGVNVVVYLAALNAVPRELLEAAALDGAGRWARFRHVTWPALTPITFYLAVVNAVGSFAVFTPTYILTGGGPDDATLTAPLYTYQIAFGAGELGYAAAISMVLFLVALVVTAGQFRLFGRRVQHVAAEA